MTDDDLPSAKWLFPNRRAMWLLGIAAMLMGVAGFSIFWSADSTGLRVLGVLFGVVFMAFSIASFVAGATPVLSFRTGAVCIGWPFMPHLMLRLDDVEAVFLGTDRPCGNACETKATTTRTLVVRLAADATKRMQGSLPPKLGHLQEDRYVILNGRWTEQLDVDTAQRVNHLLATAKRRSNEPTS